MKPTLLLTGLALLLAGCFPGSCRREEPRALLPSDSLSRQIAATVPFDTLQPYWTVSASEALPLKRPRTVQFGPDGLLYLSDAERHLLAVLDAAGTLRDTLQPSGVRYPYLAGFRHDTLVVLAPEARQLVLVARRQVVQRLPLPSLLPDRALLYAAATPQGYFVKAVREGQGGILVQLDRQGRVLRQQPLPEPYWRYAGFVRPWGDTLLSLAGFRPVIDRWWPDGRLDTLALVGFDSPMLARSRAFLVGEVHEAPLLTSSAVPVDSLLFVLNLRPGWVQIDVYGLRDGHLRHRLVPPAQPLNRRFYPHDLAVRCQPSSCLLVVVLNDPEPRIVAYRWPPPGNSAPS
ncbi:hypothetical protein [Rhodothermus profundi]|uniref:NHL repeat containing protein n=1 Tax=Rhodothermus profundi TaxID=633813 RepID=A0A1M6RHI2_9BACT|nr:hypothetical protein [Rhodothermus profundi]SHK31838.1 hypothetical protein SAMN04488087_0847 [Rhodothermus profundi]